MASTSKPLSSTWACKRYNKEVDIIEALVPVLDARQAPSSADEWMPCSCPSEIYVDLIRASLIADPFIGFNEHKAQCEHDGLS